MCKVLKWLLHCICLSEAAIFTTVKSDFIAVFVVYIPLSANIIKHANVCVGHQLHSRYAKFYTLCSLFRTATCMTLNLWGKVVALHEYSLLSNETLTKRGAVHGAMAMGFLKGNLHVLQITAWPGHGHLEIRKALQLGR